MCSSRHTFIVAKHTLLLISVLSVYTSVATSCCRSEYLVWGRQEWSSSILELTAHTTAMSSSKRVCCLISEQYVVITGGHCSSMERQRTSPGPRWTIWKKSTSTSLNLTCGLQIALIWTPWITLFRVLFSNESTTVQDGGSTAASDSHRVAKTLTMASTSWSCYQEWRWTHRALQLGLSSRTF